jgi:tetratricopeptide (TPR) repeat protein
MPSLSIVMIVKNEAHCLRVCLDSVRGIADEIVVGDTGSSDGTGHLALEAGAKVCDIPWDNDFAAARNAVLAEATGDWLLHLDADEALDPQGAQQVRALVEADGAGADAIEVTLANYCDDPRAWRWVPARPGDPWARGFSGYIAVPLLRLFRNGRGFVYREPVHENITSSVAEHGGRVGRADVLVHHYGYAASPEKSRAKAELYYAIARRKAETQPESPKAWHDLSEQAIACGHPDEAEAACRRALDLDREHLGATMTFANLLLLRNAEEEVRALLRPFVEQGTALPLMLVALAAVDAREGKLQEAQQQLEQVVAVDPPPVMALLELARVHDLAGRPDAACRQLEHAREWMPHLAEIQNRLEALRLRREAEELYVQDQTSPALERLVHAARLDSRDPLTHNDIGVVLSALGRHEHARQSFVRALTLAPAFGAARQNLGDLDAAEAARDEYGF